MRLLVGGAGALILAVGSVTTGSFVDDDQSTHRDAIEELVAIGVTRGCNPPRNDRFCPTDVVDRGQMAAFLVRAMDLPPAPVDFQDVSGSAFAADIGALAGSGIARGCDPPANTRFCPGGVVTRAQMAAFLRRELQLGPGTDRFVDEAPNSRSSAEPQSRRR